MNVFFFIYLIILYSITSQEVDVQHRLISNEKTAKTSRKKNEHLASSTFQSSSSVMLTVTVHVQRLFSSSCRLPASDVFVITSAHRRPVHASTRLAPGAGSYLQSVYGTMRCRTYKEARANFEPQIKAKATR